VVGLLVRATLLRPGRAEVRDATAFPGWDAHGSPPQLRVVALPGVVAPLALVRWPRSPGDEACVVDVELGERGGWREATGLLAAVAARAFDAGADRLVVVIADPPVARAARVLGLPAAR
jgi:hypothetical protein